MRAGPVNALVNSKVAIVTVLAFGLISFRARAASVTDWHTFRAAPPTTLAGQGTDDPIVGSLTEAASGSFLIGYAPTPFSLVNEGDQITLSFRVRFNDGAGMSSPGDNFRFAIYDLNGEARVAADNTAEAGTADTDNFRGYWFGVKSSATGAQGSMRRRTGTTPDLNPFVNASATLLGTAGGTVVPLVSSVNGDGTGPLYSGTMILQLQGGSLALSGSFSGNGGANDFLAFDSAPVTLTYGAVGFLMANPLSVDQVLFEDVSLVLIPEPGAGTMLVFGSLFVLRRRRRVAAHRPRAHPGGMKECSRR